MTQDHSLTNKTPRVIKDTVWANIYSLVSLYYFQNKSFMIEDGECSVYELTNETMNKACVPGKYSAPLTYFPASCQQNVIPASAKNRGQSLT